MLNKKNASFSEKKCQLSTQLTAILNFMKMEQKQKVEKFQYLNKMAVPGQVLFTGSSLMEHFPISELGVSKGINQIIYNRGVGGFTTQDFMEHIEELVFGTNPSKIFINIGSNDIGKSDYSLEELVKNYKNILMQVKEVLPTTKVYIMAYYPVNEVDKVPKDDWGKALFLTRTNQNIQIANEAMKDLAQEMGYEYIDVNQGLTDEHGRLKKEWTIEGVHLYPNAYEVILENLKPYL